MTTYRKKPVEVEAWQFFYDGPTIPGVFYPEISEDGRTWIGDAYVVTIHGERAHLENGDWVITEPDGEHHYPCKPEIFDATYEPVEMIDWPKAKAYLDMLQAEYEKIGPEGKFGLAITIMPLQDRYERGERTKWLYDEIMEAQ